MNNENNAAAEDQTASAELNEEFNNRLTIDKALQLGAFNLQVSCVRNPLTPEHSMYLAYLPSREHSQAISDAFESLAFQELEGVLTQASVSSVLLLGAGFTYQMAIASLQSALFHAGNSAKTDADRLRLLMVANDLLLTTSAQGVDVEEVLDPEDFMLEKWIIKNLSPSAAGFNDIPKPALLGDLLAGKLQSASPTLPDHMATVPADAPTNPDYSVPTTPVTPKQETNK